MSLSGRSKSHSSKGDMDKREAADVVNRSLPECCKWAGVKTLAVADT